MQPTDPQTRVREGRHPGPVGPPSQKALLLFLLQDESTSRHGIRSASSLITKRWREVRFCSPGTRPPPRLQGAPEFLWGPGGVGEWGAGPRKHGGSLRGLWGWLWGRGAAFAWRALGGFGIYAVACVIPEARRISGRFSQREQVFSSNRW